MTEGFLKKQASGRYGVCEIELTCGAQVKVKTVSGWVMMQVEHDGNDYYLVSKDFSFYPKKVYARYPA